jgi:hypothetical protein
MKLKELAASGLLTLGIVAASSGVAHADTLVSSCGMWKKPTNSFIQMRVCQVHDTTTNQYYPVAYLQNNAPSVNNTVNAYFEVEEWHVNSSDGFQEQLGALSCPSVTVHALGDTAECEGTPAAWGAAPGMYEAEATISVGWNIYTPNAGDMSNS